MATKNSDKKRRILFDIETVGYNLSEFTPEQQAYLLKGIQSREDIENAYRSLNLYPLTAQIVCIGMIDIDSFEARMLYQSEKSEEWDDEDNKVHFSPLNEEKILHEFWRRMENCSQIITFNGRTFDCPFVLMRSAKHKITPTKNIIPYRYNSKEHCDLLDQLTYYGATRKFNLDFYCRYFGIESPKSHGITGLDMNMLFAEKRFEDIAQYCYWDIKATAELFRIWEKYLNLEK